MPGVLILESMAQTAACLVSYEDKSLSLNNLVFFTGIEKAKFRKPVTPGNELFLKINLISINDLYINLMVKLLSKIN